MNTRNNEIAEAVNAHPQYTDGEYCLDLYDWNNELVKAWLKRFSLLKKGRVEVSNTKVIRLVIRLENPLGFRAFSLDPGGKAVGEILTAKEANAENLQSWEVKRGNPPIDVEKIEGLGIYPACIPSEETEELSSNIKPKNSGDLGKLSKPFHEVLETPIAKKAKDEFENFISELMPKNGENALNLWLKLGHNQFFKASWKNGRLSGYQTKLADKGDSSSRLQDGEFIDDLYQHLFQNSLTDKGGVFYIPTQPSDLPIASCVQETDDIGIEIDHLSNEEQEALYEEFSKLTGLKFSSLLTSGGKSIHAHIKAKDHLSLEEAGYLRRLAIIAFNSDPVTDRLHQPMRIPGFYRKEKEAFQELLAHSSERYSFEKLVTGFRKWFDHRRWVFPDSIPDQWWSEEFYRIYASGSDLESKGKAIATQKILDEGPKAFIQRRNSESDDKKAEREQRRQQFKGKPESDLLKAVKNANKLADPDSFENDWHFSGPGHARGDCPFHNSESGTAAWISDRDGIWKWHCAICTENYPRDAFEYWLALQEKIDIEKPQIPKGQEWVELAKQFLQESGYEVPQQTVKTGTTIVGARGASADNFLPRFETHPDQGLYWVIFKPIEDVDGKVIDHKRQSIRVGDHLKALGFVDNAAKDSAGLLVEFIARDGLRQLTISRAMMAGDSRELLKLLLANSYYFNHDRKKDLVKYLTQLGRDPDLQEYVITHETGWIDDSFVLPDRTYGNQNLRFRQVEKPNITKFEKRGTLKDWIKNVAVQTVGNSRLTFALGMAFAGPLNSLLGIESGGVHFYGRTSSGKTTCASICASVYGPKSKNIQQWRTTSNALEGIACEHNHLVLILDEIGQAQPRDLGNVAYMLANGKGKARMKRDAKVTPPKAWELMFLSTGEIKLQDYLNQAGVQLKGGQESRLPSIPACPDKGYGVFETCHGQKPAVFAQNLGKNCESFAGSAFDEFLKRLTQEIKNPEFRPKLSETHSKTVKCLTAKVPGDAVVERVAQRFGSIQVALELASQYEVIPHTSEDIEWAISKVFEDWISDRGGSGSIEIKQALERIEYLFSSHIESDRICLVGKSSDDFQKNRNLLAYSHTNYSTQEQEFWVPPPVFKEEFAVDVDPKLLVNELQKLGWMKGPEKGKRNHNTLRRRVNGKQQRFYVFICFWAEEDNQSESESKRGYSSIDPEFIADDDEACQ